MARKLTVLGACKVMLLACSVLAAMAGTAHAAGDPLDLSARISGKASKAMLLSVTQIGARLVAVGEHGIIVYSDNQGQSWTQAAVPVSVTLTTVQFPSAERGWAVGHDGVVLSSDDGGRTWFKRFDGNQGNALILAEAQKNADNAHHVAEVAVGAAKTAALTLQGEADNALADVQAGVKFGPSRPLLGVWFLNARDGYVVGAFGQIFHTADGGNHWESLASRLHNPDGLHYNAISMTPAGTLVISGEGGKVYSSRDSGRTWQTLDTGYKGQIYGVLGLRGDNGDEALLAYGFAGHIFLAGNGGQNWQELPSVTNKNLIGGMQFADGGVLLASQTGGLLRGDSHGHNFTIVQVNNGLAIAGAVALEGDAQVALSGVGGVHLIDMRTTGKLN
jgi:photosystem II stability/assembly factor-like uncharacterized protein